MAQLIQVLDSWPLLAYFEKQAAAPQAIEILEQAAREEKKLLISAVNWGEILYITEQRYGPMKRDQIEDIMGQMPLHVYSADVGLAREAARFKTQYKLGYADCFAAALAFLKDAQLVTGDRDFRPLKDKIRILWL